MQRFDFHPVVAKWFQSRFNGPTEPQQQGWPHISAGEHTLIAAPTGSGKTLAAFLACIDRLLKLGVDGQLGDGVRVVYVSPLRALSNDMHRNLEAPLREIMEQAEADGLELPPIRVGLRTGDTSSSQRAALVRRPPHILVTTPESLYLLLTAERGREALQTVDTMIVDEIHALVRDKRGSHLALSMERLEALVDRPLQRIGLSATQKPIERVAQFLVGSSSDRTNREPWEGDAPAEPNGAISTPTTAARQEPRPPRDGKLPTIIDIGHARQLDLAIEVPPSELAAVCTHEQWEEVNQRLIELIEEHRSTLIFVNTRRMAERLTHHLTELLGEEVVSSHHGSLAADIRLKTEQRLKSGELKAVVATASLELGLDVGYIDLVIQVGSPRSIATFLQRIGRSGHSLGLVPKGRLIALSRDELLESMALIRAVRSGRLDAVRIPEAPLDILAQQIVAEVAGQEWNVDELFEHYRRADPYRDLDRRDFDRVVEFLSEGIPRGGGRSRAFLHFDRVGRRLKPRKGARITAASNGGAIGDIASLRVVADPEGTVVGTLDEDFAVESNRGDIFLLGNTSWRILHVRGNDVTVADAKGAPPSIPFWRGEAPGRTFELSNEFSRLREELGERVDTPDEAAQWLDSETSSGVWAAEQAVNYVAAQKAAVGLLPTQQRVIFERFFDETGGMQLVVHAPFGGEICRAWALAMRKRFCRSFDFELQASADDNGFILSLGPQHSFPIESLFPMLRPDNAQGLLEQALLTHPMFQLRWRWNVTRSLQVDRMRNGRKVPPPLQRFRSDDLLTAIFPKLTGCQEEHTGDHEIPDHPLTNQTMHDCLHEALNIDGLRRVLGEVQRGEITFVARDTREPSPFSYELLNANPYAFLDGGEIQERRTRAVASRRSVNVESVRDLGRLDPEAIRQVRQEAQPLIRDADELHDALLGRIVMFDDEIEPAWRTWLEDLVQQRRATSGTWSDGQQAWVPAERLPAFAALFPEATLRPTLEVPRDVRTDWTAADARVAVVRGFVEICGPTTAITLANRFRFAEEQVSAALEALEGEGVVLRGHFEEAETEQDGSGSQPAHEQEWSATESQIELQEGGRGSRRADEVVNSCAIPAPQERRPPDSETESATPKAPPQWCHRRLLARIHRLTMQGLRREIEPVSVSTFIRFLTRHHGLLDETQRSGANGLFDAIALLQGIDAPAITWERDLLPGRVEEYRPEWLDELCLNGEVGWGRLFPTKHDPEKARPMASLTRVAPISIWLRGDLPWILPTAGEISTTGLSSPAGEVVELLTTRGAMFAADLMSETRMLPSQLDDVLGELVTRGLVTADGFTGVRHLLASRQATKSGRRRRTGLARQRNAHGNTGRWSLWRTDDDENATETPVDQDPQTDHVEQWAWQLLRRWGVIFRDLLVRESGAPSWFALLQVYRRLEARGEIRGGRFVSGVAGEQFAAGDVVRQLRQLRDSEPEKPEVVRVSAADPLNLVGILTEQARVPSTASNSVIWCNGQPATAIRSEEVQELSKLDDREKQLVDKAVETAMRGGSSDDQQSQKRPAANAGKGNGKNGRRPRRRQGIPRPFIT